MARWLEGGTALWPCPVPRHKRDPRMQYTNRKQSALANAFLPTTTQHTALPPRSRSHSPLYGASRTGASALGLLSSSTATSWFSRS